MSVLDLPEKSSKSTHNEAISPAESLIDRYFFRAKSAHSPRCLQRRSSVAFRRAGRRRRPVRGEAAASSCIFRSAAASFSFDQERTPIEVEQTQTS
ncbi:hypothetical protein [Methylosinus sp. Ce-a6]|uniref:hypothetical protein n=1 Tax=Methylosinus sp. Ce-a6 TaxID=2172005 RepID=UPI001916527C|nr:hypothetical protein [Methylosinus sp. Ce-a6]